MNKYNIHTISIQSLAGWAQKTTLLTQRKDRFFSVSFTEDTGKILSREKETACPFQGDQRFIYVCVDQVVF